MKKSTAKKSTAKKSTQKKSTQKKPMKFKPGDEVRYIGDDTPELAKGVTGTVKSSTALTAKVDFNGTVHEVVLTSLKLV